MGHYFLDTHYCRVPLGIRDLATAIMMIIDYACKQIDKGTKKL